MRKVVKFLRTNDDFSQTVDGTVIFDGKKITFKDLSPPKIHNLEKFSILIGNKAFYPKDGLEFLENLKFAFSGTMLRATDVEEVEI